MQRVHLVTLLLLGLLPGCTQYPYAKNVKMLSYEDNVMVGKSIGPVRGESCQVRIMGYPIGGLPTLDKALYAARAENKIRYLNNVKSDVSQWDAVVYGRTCLAVEGTGFE